MTEGETTTRSIAQAIQDELVPSGGVLVNYVVVATYDDGESQSFVADCSEEMLPWHRTGMLNYAINDLDWND